MPRYEYVPYRTTYDKMKDLLVILGEQGWRVQAHFVGGRDWVLICEREVSA